MKTVAVIQARMSSTRFPGKVLADLAGKPLLWHLIHRLKKSRYITDIVIATSVLPSDDPLENFASQHQIGCIRGPLDNVLKRFEIAFRQTEPDFLVRITGDAPLVDANVIDQMVEKLAKTGADRIDNGGVASIHSGFEVVSGALFERLLDEFADNPFAREHVTGVLGAHPDIGKTTEFAIDPAHLIENARTSVDTPADLAFMERIHTQLKAPAGEIDVTALVRLLKSNPALLDINSHIRQKRFDEETIRLLFITEAGGSVGMGHINRILALADICRTQFSHGITIACRGEIGCAAAKTKGFATLDLPKEHELGALLGFLEGSNTDAIIMDVRSFLDEHHIHQLRANGKKKVLLATIDDGSDRRHAGDLAFLPPTPRACALEWQEGTKPHIGWDFIIVPPLQNIKEARMNAIPRVLLTMGGSDPFGLTDRFAALLADVNAPFELSVLIGPGFEAPDKLRRRIRDVLPSATIIDPVDDISTIIECADVLITAYGVTIFEAATLGRASLFVTHSDDDTLAASALEKTGSAICLGNHHKMDTAAVAKKIENTLRSADHIAEMGERAAEVVDGHGANRIALIIDEEIKAARRSS